MSRTIAGNIQFLRPEMIQMRQLRGRERVGGDRSSKSSETHMKKICVTKTVRPALRSGAGSVSSHKSSRSTHMKLKAMNSFGNCSSRAGLSMPATCNAGGQPHGRHAEQAGRGAVYVYAQLQELAVSAITHTLRKPTRMRNTSRSLLPKRMKYDAMSASTMPAVRHDRKAAMTWRQGFSASA